MFGANDVYEAKVNHEARYASVARDFRNAQATQARLMVVVREAISQAGNAITALVQNIHRGGPGKLQAGY